MTWETRDPKSGGKKGRRDGNTRFQLTPPSISVTQPVAVFCYVSWIKMEDDMIVRCAKECFHTIAGNIVSGHQEGGTVTCTKYIQYVIMTRPTI